MTITERNQLVDISKTKRDGVYSKKPFTYAVKDGRMVAYSDYFGNLYRCFSSFNQFLFKVERHEIRNYLKDIIKSL